MTPNSTDPALSTLVRRVLWPGFAGRTVPDWLAQYLHDGLGGVVYFAHNLDAADPEQPLRLSDEVHAIAPDALIGIDEEGGIVTRLQATHGSAEPGNAVLGRVDDVAATARSAERTGRLVGAAGIDVDLAPDADVNADPNNPVIGVRSFGADPALVARHTAAAVLGIQAAGVAACAKHFPGHGDTAVDSHLDLATSELSAAELRRVHLPPFAAAVDAGVRTVMTAHIRIPALGDEPATINPRALGLLRDEIDFDGVIISDALDMAAIRAHYGCGPGAVAALRAGVDLLCLGNPGPAGGPDQRILAEVEDAILAAVEAGDLEVGRLEQAAARIAELAGWRREHGSPARPPLDGTEDAVGLAARALRGRGDVRLRGGHVLVIDARARASIAAGAAPDHFTTALRDHGLLATRVSVAGLDAALAARQAATSAAAHDGEVVLIVGQPQSASFEADSRAAVLAARPDAVVLHTGWPAPVPTAGRVLFTFGAAQPNAEAAARALVGSDGAGSDGLA